MTKVIYKYEQTKDKRNEVEAKTTKRTAIEWNDHEREHNIRIKYKKVEADVLKKNTWSSI